MLVTQSKMGFNRIHRKDEPAKDAEAPAEETPTEEAPAEEATAENEGVPAPEEGPQIEKKPLQKIFVVADEEKVEEE